MLTKVIYVSVPWNFSCYQKTFLKGGLHDDIFWLKNKGGWLISLWEKYVLALV